MRELRIASTNAGKVREFRQVLEPLGFVVHDLSGIDNYHVVEDGDTFEANAIKKAQTLVDLTGVAAVADDSGLSVDALDGAPGIYSARYAGVDGNDQDAANRRKLVQALLKVPAHERSARFVCALAFCAPGVEPVLFHGEVHGRIIDKERGAGGFGYDSLFLIPEQGRTTAEMPAEEKNAISHRGKALRLLAAYLAETSKPR